MLEERVGGVAKTQYVWSPVYVDALVERDRDADGNSGTGTGGREERLYAQQDGNWNTTALVGQVGGVWQVVERYQYDPFGQQTVMDASWTPRTGNASLYGWVVGFQGLRHSAVTGLDHARNRDYSPTLGRFVSIDPIGYTAGDVNLFRFVGNSPTVSIDPTGLDRCIMSWGPHLWLRVDVYDKKGNKIGSIDLDRAGIDQKESGKSAWVCDPCTKDSHVRGTVSTYCIKSTPGQDQALLDFWMKQKGNKNAPNNYYIWNPCFITALIYLNYGIRWVYPNHDDTNEPSYLPQPRTPFAPPNPDQGRILRGGFGF